MQKLMAYAKVIVIYFMKYKKSFITLITVVGFLLSPLKDIAYHMVWKEKAQIKIFPENKIVSHGDIVSLQLEIIPVSSTEISSGTCKIWYDENYFEIQSGNTNLNIKALNEPFFVPEVKEIKLETIKEGSTTLKAFYMTRYGKYFDSCVVHIKAPSKSEYPTLADFSGIWPLKLGPWDGGMELMDRDGTLNGRYILKNGEKGAVSGLRDGSSFVIDFIRKGETVMWDIKAGWKPINGFIEISGKAKLLPMKNDKSMNIDKNEYDFFSTVKLH